MASNKRQPANIGARVQSLREQFDMTQAELAKVMKVSRETLNHWESNAREIKANQILKLAQHFNVTCDYILRGVNPENIDINKRTGLSEKAISYLEYCYKNLRGYDVAFLNHLIENCGMQMLCSELMKQVISEAKREKYNRDNYLNNLEEQKRIADEGTRDDFDKWILNRRAQRDVFDFIGSYREYKLVKNISFIVRDTLNEMLPIYIEKECAKEAADDGEH